MDDCVFCNIINKTIDSKLLYEDGEIVVIQDILPKAPVHLLIVPKEHIPSVSKLLPRHEPLSGKMVYVGKDMAEKNGIAESGYKLIFNVGRDGGQVVKHIHLHLLGGKQLPE